jgi:hypothetical protein
MPHGLAHGLAMCSTREEALRRAHREGGMTMVVIGRQLGLTGARVGQLNAGAEAQTGAR